MKHSTRRTLEKWIVPGIVGGVFGAVYGWSEAGGNDAEALLLVAGLVGLALSAWDMWRSDEMERRIYFVAMTASFFGTGATVLVAGLAQLLGAPVPNWGWATVPLFVFYVVGWWAAWWRLR